MNWTHVSPPQDNTALDTLRQWQKTYSRELDYETQQECAATERLLRKALAGGGESSSSQESNLGFSPSKRPLQTLLTLPLMCVQHSARCSPSGQAFGHLAGQPAV